MKALQIDDNFFIGIHRDDDKRYEPMRIHKKELIPTGVIERTGAMQQDG